jgi:type IV pilus assembly protein PilV
MSISFRAGKSDQQQKGFTLIEILVSVLIFAMGLLGLASLHVVGQRSNHDAFLRSQAIIQAYDMADRMRVNRAGVEAGAYDAITPPAGSASNACLTSGCTSAELAAIDAAEWQSANANILPLGQGSVTANNNGTYTITVTWDEDRDGLITEDVDTSFTTEVRP